LFSEVEPGSPSLYFCVGAAFSHFDAVSRTLLTEADHPHFNPGLMLILLVSPGWHPARPQKSSLARRQLH
jgi:hypothetical protein